MDGTTAAERSASARVAAAEALKSELFAVVSHEFRTPLTSIIGYARTLAARFDELDRETQLDCIRKISGEARRLEWLVHNVLAASGEPLPTSGEHTDLAAVTSQAVRGLPDVPAAAGRVLHVDVPAGLVAAVDHATADRIVTNLIDNALKFGEPGTPVWVRAQREPGRVRFEVGNVAEPFDPEQLDVIFHPFVQLDSSDTRRADGIGLGLHVVRRLVEARGGDISVRHDPCRVWFTVTLPAGPVE